MAMKSSRRGGAGQSKAASGTGGEVTDPRIAELHRRPIIPRSVGGSLRAFGGREAVYMGWMPDIPDMRDFTLDSKDVSVRLRQKKSKVLRTDFKLDKKWDNSHYCSEVEDQENLGSCTAQAVVGMLEYMMRRSHLDYVDGSRLFVYKVTRKLLGWTGDTGAYLRTAMQAVVTFGMPPEIHFPYDTTRFEEEPDAFLYAYAGNFKALDYTRLDPPHIDAVRLLLNLKHTLRAKFTVVFGFSVYSSIGRDEEVPYPSEHDKLTGGHAVLAVGYDDDRVIGDCKGAIKFKNSWGTDWGADGYGWLPYKYVETGLARDFWTVFKAEWIDTGQFR